MCVCANERTIYFIINRKESLSVCASACIWSVCVCGGGGGGGGGTKCVCQCVYVVYIISLKDFNLTERREGISSIAVCYTPYFVLLLFQKGNLAKVLSVRFLQISVGKHSNSVNL